MTSYLASANLASMPKESKEEAGLMSKEGVEGEGLKTPKRSKNSPQVSKATWEAVRVEFESGTYVSLLELSQKHGVAYKSLRNKIWTQKWNERQRTLHDKVSQRVESNTLKAVDLATSYLQNSFKRGKRLEVLVDASIAQNATNSEGVEVVAPADLDAYSRTENRIHELCLSALRLPRTVSVDLTSKGASIGESIVSALEKLRASGAKPMELDARHVDAVIEMEIIPDPK